MCLHFLKKFSAQTSDQTPTITLPGYISYSRTHTIKSEYFKELVAFIFVTVLC